MHIEKYQRSATGRIMEHYRRGPGALKRPNVDEGRTPLNYTLAQASDGRVIRTETSATSDSITRHIERCDALAQAEGRRRTRKDAVVLVDIVVTLPKNVPDQDISKFFEMTFKHLLAKVGGSDNQLGGYVHLDETTPHMHFAFTPIVDGRFNAKSLLNRSFYQHMHRDLADALEQEMGYRPEIELSEERKAERVLSKVSQTELDAARKALVDPLKAEQELEQERLECLRRARSAAQDRVAELANQVGGARARAAELESSNRGLRARLADLRERLRAAVSVFKALGEVRTHEEPPKVTQPPTAASVMAGAAAAFERLTKAGASSPRQHGQGRTQHHR